MSSRKRLTVQTCLVLTWLSRDVDDQPHYAYEIQRDLCVVDMTSMTDLTRRLVRDGYIAWCDGPQYPRMPHRKYFRLTVAGRAAAVVARQRLREFGDALDRLGIQHSDDDDDR